MTAEIMVSTPYALLGGELGIHRRGRRFCALTTLVLRSPALRPKCTADRWALAAAGRA